MKPYIHAKNSANKYGGKPEDYMHIHEFFDSSKIAYAEIKHRAMLHNTFGIFMIEKVFGSTFVNSDGKVVSVRDVAEDHVVQDLGFIPTVEDWVKEIPLKDWMVGSRRKEQKLNSKDFTIVD